MNDPYETLGVERDADEKEIRKAYLRRSKKAHPDAGGSHEEMAALTRAMDIIGDPEKRKRFDSGGDMNVPDEETLISQRFASLALELMMNVGEKSIKKANAAYRAQVEQKYAAEKQAIETQRQKMEAFILRVEKSPDNDVIGGIAAGMRRDLDRALEALETKTRIERAALDRFDDYMFKEPAEMPQNTSSGPFMRISLDGGLSWR